MGEFFKVPEDESGEPRQYDHNVNPHGEAGTSSSRLHERMDAMGDVADPVGYESTRTRPWGKPAQEIKEDLGEE